LSAEKTVLVIEDETAILTFLRSSLEQNGWTMLEARNGRVGLELAASKKPSVILLDLGLPIKTASWYSKLCANGHRLP